MRPALAPLAAALLGAACSGSADPTERAPAGSTITAQRPDPVATIAGERAARVLDRAEVLSAEAERALAARSAAIEAATSDQVAVVTVPELGGLSIEEFGLALGNNWGIGRADLDNGVILLVAPSERRVRVEVGSGLESVLTDARAAEIVARMVEQFRRGEFEGGIAAGLGEIEAVLRARAERRRAA